MQANVHPVSFVICKQRQTWRMSLGWEQRKKCERIYLNIFLDQRSFSRLLNFNLINLRKWFIKIWFERTKHD